MQRRRGTEKIQNTRHESRRETRGTTLRRRAGRRRSMNDSACAGSDVTSASVTCPYSSCLVLCVEHDISVSGRTRNLLDFTYAGVSRRTLHLSACRHAQVRARGMGRVLFPHDEPRQVEDRRRSRSEVHPSAAQGFHRRAVGAVRARARRGVRQGRALSSASRRPKSRIIAGCRI